MNETPLSGQHAVITGASRGIGWAITRKLAAMGAAVTLIARNPDTLAAREKELAKDGAAGIFTAAADVTDEKAVAAAFAEAADALGAPAILVNNAGNGKSAPFERTDLKFWRAMIDINLTSTYLCSHLAYGAMKEAGYGRIVNIASTVGLTAYAYVSAYATAKHGVIGLTRALAVEAAKSGVTVNAVCPGFTDTDMMAEAVDNIVAKTKLTAADARAHMAGTNPQGHIIDPGEVADMVGYLCLPSSSAITGQAMVIAGGAVMN